MGCQVQTDPRDIPPVRPDHDPNSPLIGTRWIYAEWGDQIVYFETAETVVFRDETHAYFYDSASRSGWAESLNHFVVEENYEKMTFLSWRNYGHPADFKRIKD